MSAGHHHDHHPHRGPLLASLSALYLIWGSTYLAAAYCLRDLPPFVITGVRFTLAGAGLYAFARLRGAPAPNRAQWMRLTVIGALLIVGGNAGVVWAQKTVASGVVALMIGMMPIWMSLIDWLFAGGAKPTARATLGMACGLCGVGLLLNPFGSSGGREVSWEGFAAVLLATLAWATGSVITRHSKHLPKNGLLSVGAQMFAGGLCVALMALVSGDYTTTRWSAVSSLTVFSMLWLMLAGSIITFVAYNWLLQNTTPAVAGSYAYVNPLIAVLLGWRLNDEPLSLRIVGAGALIIVGVALIILRKRVKRSSSSGANAPLGAPSANART